MFLGLLVDYLGFLIKIEEPVFKTTVVTHYWTGSALYTGFGDQLAFLGTDICGDITFLVLWSLY